MLPPPPGSAREPIFNLPAVVLAAILALIGLHALREWVLSDVADLELLLEGAVVPVRWTAAYAGQSPDEILAELSASGDGRLERLQLELARYVLEERSGKPWTGLSYALLHGSWTHVALNSVWLAAFGTPVARRCGAWRFVALAAATAFAGAVAHTLVHPLQALPMVGASAAVSGMMAAAAWFMFARPVWLLDGRLADPHERPREHLARMLRDRRVIGFVAAWFATNFVFALVARPLGITDASIAWEAHAGGFVAGLLLFPWLDPLPGRARG
jgi:membrane associated rhomboid family serine protease